MVFSAIRILLLLSLLSICRGILIPLFVYQNSIFNLINFGFEAANLKPLNDRAIKLRTNYCNASKTNVARLDSSRIARCWLPENPEIIKCQEEVFHGMSLPSIRDYVCGADETIMKQVTQSVTECVKRKQAGQQQQQWNQRPTSNVRPTVVIILGRSMDTDNQQPQTSDRQSVTEYFQVPDFTSVSSKQELINKLDKTLACYENIIK